MLIFGMIEILIFSENGEMETKWYLYMCSERRFFNIYIWERERGLSGVWFLLHKIYEEMFIVPEDSLSLYLNIIQFVCLSTFKKIKCLMNGFELN